MEPFWNEAPVGHLNGFKGREIQLERAAVWEDLLCLGSLDQERVNAVDAASTGRFVEGGFSNIVLQNRQRT